MCGICGVLSLAASEPIDPEAVRAMTARLAHRGPDADGFLVRERVGLGFRRLSIVDLQTGDQPMANEDESVWLIFNGEIYNHLDHRSGLEALVRESIRLRMMSDVPYGAFLSGGVDSSLNVALMAELADRPVSTFSVAIEGDAVSDELLDARQVAERYGTQHHEVVISDRDFLDYMPRLVWQQDEPLADPVCVPLHAISEAARQSGTRVVQVGEGSDELFAGYTSYAFFLNFHRRVWRRYQVVPGRLRRALAGTAGAWLTY